MRPTARLISTLPFAIFSFAALLIPVIVRAQQASEQAPALPVLHIYANLIQIPVLVLSNTREKVYDRIASDRFSLSFDSGAWIKASNAHLEGDDPIDLSIVVDARSPEADILPTLDQAIARLVPVQLHPSDHVSIYVMACNRVRSVRDVPANATQLKSAADTALTDVMARHAGKDKSPCSENAPLWDLLAYATNNLAKAPGRRVVLAITNGDDKKSQLPWNSLITFAQNLGVTIFALNPDLPSSRTLVQSNTPGSPFGGGSGTVPSATAGTLNLAGNLPAISELTGGIMLRLDDSNAYNPLKNVIEMIRDRYIIDFPRPAGATAGTHNLQVRIDRGTYFIRPAGDAVPVAAPGQNDPNTLHPGTATTIQMATTTPDAQLPASPPDSAQPPQPQLIQQASAAQRPASAPPPVATPQPEMRPSSVPSPPIPDIKVAVRLTLVDVTVTDRDNHPLRGLLKPDFTVKEDGKPQAIHDFAEYGAGSPTKSPALAALPPNTYSNQISAASATVTNVILFDEVTTGLTDHLSMAPDNLMYAKKAATSYLKSMPAGTRVAILLFGNGMHVIQEVTADRNVLLSVVDGLTYKAIEGTYHKVPGDGCEAANTQSRLQLEALREIASFVAGIKGRKNLIWFTPGTPWLTNYLSFSRSPCLINFTAELNQTYGALTAAQVPLYPVDPRGVKVTGATAETSQAFDAGGHTSQDFDLSGEQAQDSLIRDRASVADMAAATGGISYTNRNDLDAALDDAISIGADYYSLSYIPPRVKQDGLYHSISIAVDRPTTRLQYSSGYNDVDLSELKHFGNSAFLDPNDHPEMQHDRLNSTQVIFNLRPDLEGPHPTDAPVLGVPNPALKNARFNRYTFHYTFTPAQMSFTDDPGGTRYATIEFALAAFDADGNRLNNIRQQLKLTVHPGQSDADMTRLFDSPIAFDVPSSTATIRAGIFDLTAKKSGTVDFPLIPLKP